MRQAITLILSIVCVFAAQAQGLRADSLELYPVDAPVGELIYRAGVVRPTADDLRLTLIWNHTDSTSERRAVFCVPGTAHDDGLTAPRLRWSVVERRCGRDSLLAEGDADLSASVDNFTVSLTASDAGSRLRAGGAVADVDIAVPFDRDSAGCLGLQASRDVRLSEHHLYTTPPVRLEDYPATMADIEARLEASTDAAEGFWLYLDRDTDATKANPARTYTLVTLADGKGGYTVVDVSESAHPGVKGHLTPLPFEGHYALQWHTADGRYLTTDTGATLTHDATVLTLTFPLHRATLRFYRRPGKK